MRKHDVTEWDTDESLFSRSSKFYFRPPVKWVFCVHETKAFVVCLCYFTHWVQQNGEEEFSSVDEFV